MDAVSKILSEPDGAHFYRADLHVHSFGGSHDVTDVGMTPEAIVRTAKTEGIQLLAITDHNESTNVERALAEGARLGVCVIPAVELSTPEGHVLAYFESCASLVGFLGRLTLAGRSTKESRCSTAVLQVLTHVHEFGGFAILAHVDGAGGLEEKVPGFSPHKRDILGHRSLLGLEIRDAAASSALYSPSDAEPERVRIARHRIETLRLGSKQHLAKVLFSDSHSLKALGRNAKGDRHMTRFKMDQPSFGGVRMALEESDARVRLEDELPASIPFIEGASIDGGFLDGTTIRLSRNLTCIIGGRGAGKSTAFECIRSLTSTESKASVIDSDAWPSRIDLLAQESDGVLHQLRRDRERAPQRMSGDGPPTFHVECYGQGEAAETSTRARVDPTFLLSFVDGLIDLGALELETRQLCERLLENQTAIEKSDIEVARIPEFEARLRSTRTQLEALKQQKGKEVVELEQRVALEAAQRDLIARHISDAVTAYRPAGASAFLAKARGVVNTEAVHVGHAAHGTVVASIDRFEQGLAEAQKPLSDKLDALKQEVDVALESWREAERRVIVAIDERRTTLAAQGVKLDMAYIKKLADDEASYSKSVANLTTWRVHREERRVERLRHLSELEKLRSSISARRVAYAKTSTGALAETLGDLAVSIKFVAGALSPDAETIIVNAMGWRTSRVPWAANIVKHLTVPGLIAAIRRQDPSPLLVLRDDSGAPIFNRGDAVLVLERLREQAHQFALERCDVHDLPRVTVSKVVVADGESHRVARDFSDLSLGQQQSVLLALLLASDSRRPLLIDQPEDNLDGEFIYNALVPALRRAKERRQVVIVTHNANIAVLGDADLIVALKSVSTKGQIVARGSIDDPATCAVACQILEGSQEAFQRRARTYGVARA